MFEILAKTIVTFLVVYALIEMISKVFGIFFSNSKSTRDIYIFIHVKNQENSLEYIVRTTIFNYLNFYGGREIPYIVIVDKGSVDKTEEISKRLCSDYDFLYYATEEEYLKFKNEIK